MNRYLLKPFFSVSSFTKCNWDSFMSKLLSMLHAIIWFYQLVYSPVNGHLGFQYLTITNKAAINIHVEVYMWTCAFISLHTFSLSQYIDEQLAIWQIYAYLVKKLTHYFLKWLCHFTVPLIVFKRVPTTPYIHKYRCC